MLIIVNNVHDVQCLRNFFEAEFSIYHWSNGVENFFCIFRGRNIKKSERNNIHYCESVFLVMFFVIILAKFRPIEFLQSNREQLHYVHFACSPLFYLSNINLLHQYFLFLYKNISFSIFYLTSFNISISIYKLFKIHY